MNETKKYRITTFVVFFITMALSWYLGDGIRKHWKEFLSLFTGFGGIIFFLSRLARGFKPREKKSKKSEVN